MSINVSQELNVSEKEEGCVLFAVYPFPVQRSGALSIRILGLGTAAGRYQKLLC